MHWLVFNLSAVIGIKLWRLSGDRALWVCVVCVAVVCGLIFLVQPTSRSGLKRVASVFFLALLLVAASLSFYQVKFKNARLLTEEGSREFILEGEVNLPIVRTQDKLSFPLNVVAKKENGQCAPSSHRALIQVACFRECPEVRPFDHLEVSCKVKPVKNLNTPGTFDWEAYGFSKGILERCSFKRNGPFKNGGFESSNPVKWAFRKIDQFKMSMQDRHRQRLSQEAYSLFSALIFGSKEDIDKDLYALFSRLQISHLFVVSGSHLSGIWLALFFLLKWGLVRFFRHRQPNVKKGGVVASFVATSALCMIFGLQVSLLRVLFCGTLVCLAILLGRRAFGMMTLGVASGILLVVNPFLLFDPSFLLSFLAVFAILLLTPRMGVLARQPVKASRSSWKGGLLKCARALEAVFNTSLAAACGLAPLVMAEFHYFNIIGMFFNVVAIPFVMLGLMPLALLELVLVPASDGLLNVSVRWFIVLCRFFDGWTLTSSFVFQPTLVEILVYGLAVGVIVRQRWLSCKRGLLFALLIGFFLYQSTEFSWLTRGGDSKKLSVSFLDVGQGDSTLIRLPGDFRILVDAGRKSPYEDAGQNVVLPFFARQRIGRLDAVVLTHFDSDHFGGVFALMDLIQIKEIWLSSYPQKSNSMVEEFVEEVDAHGIPVKIITAGRRGEKILELGGVSVFSLWPTKKRGGKRSDNEKSIVLKIVRKQFSLLLAGDLSLGAEKKLIARYDNALRVDVLMVPHHGSKAGTSERFLQYARPRISLISAGFENAYGFPSGVVIERLKACGSLIVRTGVDGSLHLTIDEAGEFSALLYRNDASRHSKPFDIATSFN